MLICPVCRGAKGGRISAQNMTAAERIDRAKKAVNARWKRYRQKNRKT
jgi:hypothetical protein